MESGFYWYLPTEDEAGELEGCPQVVQVIGQVVYACGECLGVRVDEARGVFAGPLRCPWVLAPDVVGR